MGGIMNRQDLTFSEDGIGAGLFQRGSIFMARFGSTLFLIVLTLTCVHEISAQNYPSKPIRIVTASLGGGTDFVSRLIANGMSSSLGQQIVVDNRSTALIGGIVAQAAPDGYTLLINGTSFWLAPLLVDKPTYDVPRDFAPISLLTTSPTLILVHSSLPVNSVKQLIALAKTRPGQINYGSSTSGAPTHLAGELFKALAGVDIVRIPYSGNGPALIALVSGEVQIMFSNAGSATQHIEAGRLRALAVASAKPTALALGMPTVAATVPGYIAGSTYGFFAPAGTPLAIIYRLNQEVVRFINSPNAKDRLFQTGVEVVGSTPEQLAAMVANDLRLWGKVIRDKGIRGE